MPGLKSGRGVPRSGLLERESSRRHGSSSRFFANFSYAANVILLVYLFVSNQHLLEKEKAKLPQAAPEDDQCAQTVVKLTAAMDEIESSSQQLKGSLSELRDLNVKMEPKGAIARLEELKATRFAQMNQGGASYTNPGGSDTAKATPRSFPSLPAASTAAKTWLFLGIPTVPRRNDVDYLGETLSSLVDQLPSDAVDPFANKVKVVVMNNKPGTHKVYENRRAFYNGGQGGLKAAHYLEFRDNPGTVADPAPHLPDPDDLNNPTNRPGREVRKQTCDLISLMELAANTSEYYMFMEDDFHVCPHFLRATHYVIEKANHVKPNWLGIRVSYGMNGIVMRSADLLLLSKYLREHTARLPPDLLWQEWVAKSHQIPELEGRQLLVYKHNLLNHIGTVSSFAVRPNRPKWPGCYESMANVWSLMKMEQFDQLRCPQSDISPCNNQSPGPDWTAKQINFRG
mmetsp:Transcript_35408/g.59675  ORF Transcript_35408/g.59675 Transcript_35408/m.59675 type:complete len:456 (-) Transcript_35408:522-1889(-)|eukprot:CAMPEP_0198208868 /NCGR_PEP_ID=MMETSP1445-20131203/12202_1 /TAXON_ID=36898 /ORGANISM="Pyramimonas sp., Strain CCMP2087" /LENGTH=455 /DNA_ID=CAMNT_0043882431 /DNA_START=155 /DNA_END=1522 /DNA_ORIENTATION=-